MLVTVPSVPHTYFMGTAISATVDGRTARKLENRDKILDAALDLVAAGRKPGVELIAANAGVSVRSVYNHFPTTRDLIAGMYQRATDRVRPLLAQMPSSEASFEERLAQWVEVRGLIHEEMAAIRWQALVAEEQHPERQPELAALRTAHRMDVQRMFPELGDRALAAAVAITDSLAWRALRKHQGLSFEESCEVVTAAIRKLAE